MSQNYVHLNTGKTEQILIGPKQDQRKFEAVLLCFDGSVILQCACFENLGVLFDLLLCFDQHVKSITRIAIFHLRNLEKNLTKVICSRCRHLFISSRLDYCNSLLSGLPHSTTRGVQLVQNAAARLLTRTRRCDHTPLFSPLYIGNQ